MHELPITQSILEIALRHANGHRITDVYLVIGDLASVVDDSVQFYWEILTKDTPAEGSRLHFKRVPAELQCMNCARKFRFNGEGLVCPDCGSVGVKVLSGEEFYMEAIEVADRTEDDVGS
ncbi:MAG: hydrogenase maturation nickel metallochaperone HypA [Anaerolineae bacterium]|nr:MAG: hydrogenase maturation nickel metallochaperone HypA [Anaerolineae bacterium]